MKRIDIIDESDLNEAISLLKKELDGKFTNLQNMISRLQSSANEIRNK